VAWQLRDLVFLSGASGDDSSGGDSRCGVEETRIFAGQLCRQKHPIKKALTIVTITILNEGSNAIANILQEGQFSEPMKLPMPDLTRLANELLSR
jgi:hypothetical protein